MRWGGSWLRVAAAAQLLPPRVVGGVLCPSPRPATQRRGHRASPSRRSPRSSFLGSLPGSRYPPRGQTTTTECLTVDCLALSLTNGGYARLILLLYGCFLQGCIFADALSNKHRIWPHGKWELKTYILNSYLLVQMLRYITHTEHTSSLWFLNSTNHYFIFYMVYLLLGHIHTRTSTLQFLYSSD